MLRQDVVTPMVKRLSCLPSKQAARVRLPFGVLHPEYCIFFLSGFLDDCPSSFLIVFAMLVLSPVFEIELNCTGTSTHDRDTADPRFRETQSPLLATPTFDTIQPGNDITSTTRYGPTTSTQHADIIQTVT
jgi:hypothetical protein